MAEPRAFMTITLFSTNLSGPCPGSGEIVTVPNLIFAAIRLMDMVFVAVELAVTVTDAHAGLATVATSVAEARSSIIGLSLTEESPNPVVTVTVQVRDSSHLIHVMRTLRQNDAVKKVKRVMD